MTSWRFVSLLSLSVFLSTIDPSQEDCHDIFEMEDWTKYPTGPVTIIKAKDSMDTVECTAERECQQRVRKACDLLFNCFDRIDNKTSEKCQVGNSTNSVHYYQFMCFAANTLNYSPQVFVQATTLSPTTTLPETTAAATIAALPSTAPTPTPTVTQTTDNGDHGQYSGRKEDDNKDADTLKLHMLLMVSGILNVVLPLAVFLYMRRREQRRSRMQWTVTHVVSNGNPQRDQPETELQTDTPLPSVNVDVETETLIQPSASVLTREADVTSESCAAREGTQH